MGEQAISERIISDARLEAEAIISAAESKAEQTIAEANRRAERKKIGVQAEVGQKSESIKQGKAATARLDSAKIVLAEKRGVIDEIYARALKQLLSLGKAEALYLSERLLNEYAEQGDEIAFASSFRYAQDVAKLAVVKEKGLKVSAKLADVEGGFVLVGKNSDKDLSYAALLAADREQKQAELAAKLFG